MSRRASSSRVVSRGTLRVDARRARQKVREHLLVDLHLYLLELVRCAVAASATHVVVDHDADDLWIAWNGAPPPEDSVVRLLDHLFDDATQGPRAAMLRLLALGVNAALGLGPRWVDVLLRQEGSARATRVRWTPSLLEADGEEPERDACAPPRVLGSAGTCVHVRRALGMAMVKRALGEVPRELELLAAATQDLEVPITVRGRPLERPKRPATLVRTRLDVRGARRAWLEITEPAEAAAAVELLERGVRLVRQGAAWEGEIPIAAWRGVNAPLRVVVDCDVLPTNASRSAVRDDAGLVEHITRAAPAALNEAVSALVKVFEGETSAGDDLVEVISRDAERVEAALGALACLAHGQRRQFGACSTAAARLLDLPLLRDGIGRPRTIGALPPAGAVVHVWEAEQPLSADLEPWAGDMVWKRGSVAEHALEDLATVDASEVVDRAKKAASRRREHLTRPPSPPSLGGGRTEHVLRETFRVDAGELAGLGGEVGVSLLEGSGRPRSALRVFVEQRPLATLTLDSLELPLPFEAAIEWPGHVGPTADYGGVEDDQDLRVATWAAAREAALACANLVEALDAPGAEADVWLRRTIRAAIGQLSSAASRLGVADDSRVVAADRAPRGPLAEAKVWPTTEPGRWESVDTLKSWALRTGSVCTAPPGTVGRALDGRPVVCVSAGESAWLVSALNATCVCEIVAVPYETALARGATRVDLEAALRARTAAPAMLVRIDHCRALVAAVGSSATVVWAHAGAVLGAAPWTPRFGGVAIVVDDDELVPTPQNDAPRWHRRGPWLAELERRYLEAIVAALAGAPADDARPLLPEAPTAGTASVELRTYLVRSAISVRERALRASKAGRDREGMQQLQALVESVPFVPVVAEDGIGTRFETLATVAERAKRREKIALVNAAPGIEIGDWGPILCENGTERVAFERWLGKTGYDGDAEIGQRRKAHEQQAALRLVEAASAPGMGAKLFDDERALAAVSQAIAAGGRDVAAACQSTALTWPTVQGTEAPLVHVAMRSGKVLFGRARWAAWLDARGTSSDLDRPILLVPPGPTGEALLGVLRALELSTEDVTTALEHLQARRAEGPPQAPKLTGTPHHPALRIDLSGFAAGQVEIVPGPASEVTLIGLDGVPRTVAATVPIPIRLAALVESDASDAGLQREIVRRAAEAAAKHLGDLGASWDQIPAFARAHMRALVCRAVAQGTRIPIAHARLPLFEDTRGGRHSLKTLRSRGAAVPVTTDPSPHPKRTYDPPVLCMTAEELAQLAPQLAFDDQTKQLRLDLAGEMRASAPPLDRVALTSEQRSRCPFFGEISEPGITGEIGILLPMNAGQRGIVVHATRRRLCALSDEPGWPVSAAIDAAVTPNRSFDGLADREDQGRLRAAVRGRASEILRAALEAPHGEALESQWIEATGDGGAFQVIGMLWLPRDWPTEPKVTVWTVDGRSDVALELPIGLTPFTMPIPVGGKLLVRSTFAGQPLGPAAWENVARIALRTLASMIERARLRKESAADAARVLPRYAWELALHGRPIKGVRVEPIPSFAGPAATPAKILESLRSCARVWFTRREGSAAGEFPEAAPELILVDDAGPGFSVLGNRLPSGTVCEIGGEPARPAPRAQAAVATEAEPELIDPFAGFVAPPEMAPPQPPPESWLASIRRRIVSFFQRPPPPPDPDPQLRLAVRARLAALALGAELVQDVVYARGGRPVRWDARRRAIVIDREHARIAPSCESPDDRIVELLTAAAVTELNRARTPLTDAEELRALHELLSQPPPGAAR